MFTGEMSTTERQAMGVEPMDDAEIDGFLSGQDVGILGLPTDGVPYMTPLSFGYDGEAALYFTSVLGAESGERESSEQVERARFLVYDATSTFSWRSVVLTGRLSVVPASEWDDHGDALAGAWHPELFASADLSGEVRVYRFAVTERSGVRQTGLPPGVER